MKVINMGEATVRIGLNAAAMLFFNLVIDDIREEMLAFVSSEYMARF